MTKTNFFVSEIDSTSLMKLLELGVTWGDARNERYIGRKQNLLN